MTEISTDRPEGHYWTRFGTSTSWDVMFWRGGHFWDNQDCGYLPDNFGGVGPQVFPPSDPRSAASLGVNRLGWKAHDDPSEGRSHYGYGVFGHWYAVSRKKAGVWATVHHVNGKPVHLALQVNLEAAKVAAQADYEGHILSVLSVVPVTVGGGDYANGLRRAADIAIEENERRIGLASIRIPAMATEIRKAILAEANKVQSNAR